MKMHKKMMEIKEKMREQNKLQQKLKAAEENLSEQKKKLSNLEDILQKENLDVRKLETLSITGLFYTILGSKDKQLEKEKQEALAAKLKYDECTKAISSIESEITALHTSLERLGDVNTEYEALMKEKEEMILKNNDSNTEKLLHFIDILSGLKSDKKEIKEAITVGKQLSYSLNNTVEALERARNWGTWDMFGGGLLATAAKHSNIDEAKEHVADSQNLLRKFQRELKDVNINSNLSINISSFNTFADYFFDGLISDWIVQSKINDSLNEAINMRNNVEEINRFLTKKYNDVSNQAEKMENEMNTIIESA